MSFLEVRHVQKIYTTRFGGTKVQALSDVNFTVEKGEYVAIMGESGSGKTTLLNILAALDKPTGGEVVLDGEVSCVGVGSVAKIPPGRMHAVRAFTELRIIEVQLGDVLVEEDIVRFGYYWNSIEGPKGKAVAVGDDACNEDLFGHGRAEGKDGAA